MGVSGARHVLLSVVGVGAVRHVVVTCWSSCGQKCDIFQLWQWERSDMLLLAVGVDEVRCDFVSYGSG